MFGLRNIQHLAPVTIPKRENRRFLWLLMVGHIGYQVLFIIGLNLTFASHAAVMLGTIPLQVAVYAHFRSEEKLNRKLFYALMMAFFGVILMSLQKGSNGIDLQALLGDALLLIGGFMWASYTVEIKPMLKEYKNVAISSRLVGLGAMGLAIFSLPELSQVDISQVSWMGWSGIAYSGLLSVGVAYLGWNHGIRSIGAVKTSYYQNLVPVLGVIWGVVLMGDQIGGFQIAGIAFVLSGIWFSRKG